MMALTAAGAALGSSMAAVAAGAGSVASCALGAGPAAAAGAASAGSVGLAVSGVAVNAGLGAAAGAAGTAGAGLAASGAAGTASSALAATGAGVGAGAWGADAGLALVEAAAGVALLVALAVPLSAYLVNVMEGRRTAAARVLGPVERAAFRLVRVSPDDAMDWRRFLVAALALTLIGAAALMALLMGQGALPLNPEGVAGLPLATAFNVAVSFATNTDWQAVAGESSLSYLSQMAGLAVQNFVSPAIGIAVAFALMRGLTGAGGSAVGNLFADVIRAILYLLLPLALIGALVGVAEGTPQTLEGYQTVQLVEPVAVDADGNVVDADDPAAVEEVTSAVVPLGPQASQVSIKQLGTNGGGFNGANSASALENPTPLTNALQCLAILLIPLTLVLCLGRMANDRRQGRALMAAVLVLLAVAVAAIVLAEAQATPQLAQGGAVYLGGEGQSAGNMEGKETRIGVGASAVWAAFTTAASNGSVNATMEGLTPGGALVPLTLMGLGEVVGGGAGTGLVGLLGFAVLTVFIASLMVGRTPEYLGKKIGPVEMRMAVLTVVSPALVILAGAAALCLLPGGAAAVGERGAAGFSELLYGAVSAGANNGSAMGGLDANATVVNVVLGLEMLAGRLLPMAAALALAGSLAARESVSAGAGTLSTASPLFVFLLLVIIVLVGALTLLPALALGPAAELLAAY
ncbi:potassium-transporting ATPase subunit KdpA [Adlercreutzia faecimuris]|uniref:Potassium-transporting ATPase potassium-binding subunit n=1 Tax=Adlercreutzia faecimuris TaxID=2897341 RepID=A0ABS9WG55_9ACTN|nr:potassium-transporting ATPase subunit KdpA [Adlercreutzia sp. JBNU-10]MCI2241297.1 potassium-transporting ATPase subunit KdpA [Adlercreutzia sp. JBNU-10]